MLFMLASSHTADARGGRLDVTFPQLMADGANVTAIEMQPDGKMIVAGKFTTVGPVVRHDVIRLNSDGTLDQTFDAGTGINNTGLVLAIAVQPDGKILAAGQFNMFNGVFRNALVRLNTNGSVDDSMAISGIDITYAYDVDTQPDGKIYVGATNLNGSSFIARLLPNGANDGGIGQQFFSTPGGASYRFSYLVGENKLVVGAQLFGGPNQGVLLKVLSTGGVDPNFNLPLTVASPGSLMVDSLPLANGKFLVWGRFDSIGRVPRRNIAIVNADASVDTTFKPTATGTETILAARVQADGKIMIGGRDFAPNGALAGNLARLNPDGSVDQTFDSRRGANSPVRSLQIVGARLFAGGDFFRYDRFPRAGLIRILR
jgi:uncharacterized delta-60 repeat protein